MKVMHHDMRKTKENEFAFSHEFNLDSLTCFIHIFFCQQHLIWMRGKKRLTWISKLIPRTFISRIVSTNGHNTNRVKIKNTLPFT